MLKKKDQMLVGFFCEAIRVITMPFVILSDGTHEYICGKSKNKDKQKEESAVWRGDYLKMQIEKKFTAFPIKSKTGYEASITHEHLYVGVIPRKNLDVIKGIAALIVSALADSLKYHFPGREFKVYVEINRKEGVTVRFHQLWEDELPYLTEKQIKEYEKNKSFIVISS